MFRWCGSFETLERAINLAGVAEPILQDDVIETIGLKRVADANRETEQHEVLSLLH